MRHAVYGLIACAALLVLLAIVTAERNARMSHCGCVNKANCTEPCSTCCGPNGYQYCFAHPSPTGH